MSKVPVRDPRQAELMREMRRDSVLDKKVPLGFQPPAHPDAGPTVAEYFARKHKHGQAGRFDELRKVGSWQRLWVTTNQSLETGPRWCRAVAHQITRASEKENH